MFNSLLNKYLTLWREKSIRYRVISSLVFLAVSLIVAYYSKVYTNLYSLGQPIPDILLDHIPVFDVSFIFFQGGLFFVFLLICILLLQPKYIPFTLESSALFFIIRSLFTIMTHLAPPGSATYQYIDYVHHVAQVVFTLNSGNDLFFSGHAGYPFLLALIFWKLPIARNIFIVCCVIGSVAVIMGHLHYSIDVFSAFFISYGIFEISKRVFKKEHELLAM